MVKCTLRDIARLRLRRQLLGATGTVPMQPAAVVRYFGGMQAQDYLQALWAIGVRSPAGTTEADVEAAIARGEIVRTWPMRGTLHFVAPADVRWMLRLLTPKIVAASALRQRQLELDAEIFAKSEKLLVKALQGGHLVTREAAMELLEKNKISTSGQRGYYILWRLSQEGLLCMGPRQGKAQTFVLLHEWVPAEAEKSREASLTELAQRYFQSHGPATVADFANWAGLTLADARAGMEGVATALERISVGDTQYWGSEAPTDMPRKSTQVLLLPGFDETMLGYKDRSASLDGAFASKITPGSNGIFMPTLVVDGQVAGTWKRVLKKKAVEVSLDPFAPPLSAAVLKAAHREAGRYAKFMGLELSGGEVG